MDYPFLECGRFFFFLFLFSICQQSEESGASNRKSCLYLQISRSVNNLKVEAYEPESALDHYELP